MGMPRSINIYYHDRHAYPYLAVLGTAPREGALQLKDETLADSGGLRY